MKATFFAPLTLALSLPLWAGPLVQCRIQYWEGEGPLRAVLLSTNGNVSKKPVVHGINEVIISRIFTASVKENIEASFKYAASESEKRVTKASIYVSESAQHDFVGMARVCVLVPDAAQTETCAIERFRVPADQFASGSFRSGPLQVTQLTKDSLDSDFMSDAFTLDCLPVAKRE